MNSDFNLEAYQYELPPHQIAQFPTEKREHSRLLVLDCPHELLQDMKFSVYDTSRDHLMDMM